VDQDRQQHEHYRDREKDQRRRAEIRRGPRAAETETPIFGQQAARFLVDGRGRCLGRGELAAPATTVPIATRASSNRRVADSRFACAAWPRSGAMPSVVSSPAARE
jgi:hypothetical protein